MYSPNTHVTQSLHSASLSHTQLSQSLHHSGYTKSPHPHYWPFTRSVSLAAYQLSQQTLRDNTNHSTSPPTILQPAGAAVTAEWGGRGRQARGSTCAPPAESRLPAVDSPVLWCTAMNEGVLLPCCWCRCYLLGWCAADGTAAVYACVRVRVC